MKTDLLRQYASIREELQKEKARLEKKLEAINEALGESSESTASFRSSSTASRGRGRRGSSPDGNSLKSMVLQVLGKGSLSKEEILSAVQRQGYTFNSKNPANSLGVILYGKNPRFDRANGKFGLPGGSKVQSAATRIGATAAEKPKRQMSPAARKRIGEAARRRWAAVKAAGRKSL